MEKSTTQILLTNGSVHISRKYQVVAGETLPTDAIVIYQPPNKHYNKQFISDGSTSQRFSFQWFADEPYCNLNILQHDTLSPNQVFSQDWEKY